MYAQSRKRGIIFESSSSDHPPRPFVFAEKGIFSNCFLLSQQYGKMRVETKGRRRLEWPGILLSRSAKAAIEASSSLEASLSLLYRSKEKMESLPKFDGKGGSK